MPRTPNLDFFGLWQTCKARQIFVCVCVYDFFFFFFFRCLYPIQHAYLIFLIVSRALGLKQVKRN